MFAIEALPINVAESEKTIQDVANIEAEVQPQDAWDVNSLTDLLKQDSIDMLIVCLQEKTGQTQHGTVVGYCLYQVVFEQAEILRIGTHPKYQRQGMASQLFNRLHEVLQSNQVESLLLEVRADNHAAIALYEQQNFVVIHKRKGYYRALHQLLHQAAVDALIMQRVYA